MKSTMSAIGLALAVAAGSTAAQAQYGPQAPTQAPTANPQAEQQQQPPADAPKLSPSRGAQKAIVALQEAVNANDTANIPARLAAAQAVMKTPDDRFIVGALHLKAATAAKDNAGIAAAIEAVLASGKAPQDQIVPLHGQLANTYVALNQGDRAAATLQKLLTLQPSNTEAAIVLANTLHKQGKTAEAVAGLQQRIAAAPGGKADERLYKQALQLAYAAKLPVAIDVSRQWAVAYPTTQNWRDALRIYRNMEKPPESILIDLLRLARTVNALEGTGDYHPYAFAAIEDLSPAEAKAVVEEGIAAGKINGSDKLFKDILAEATTKSAGQRDRLAALAKDGAASPNAKLAVTAANIHYGYGDYQQAAELYRAALNKSGADKDLVNLRLGMSLARAGDKAGATAALNAVTGPRAQVAKYWLAYLQTRA